MPSRHLPPVRAALALGALAVALLALTATAAGAQKVASSPSGSSVTEGSSRTYDLALSQPIIYPAETPIELQSVTLALSANVPGRVTLSPSSVTWLAHEWYQTRSIVVTASANEVVGDSGPITLSGTVVSGAPYYNGYVAQVTFQVIDASPAATTTSAPPATTSTSSSTSTSTSTTLAATPAATGAPVLVAPQDVPLVDAPSGDPDRTPPVETPDAPSATAASPAAPSTTTAPAAPTPAPVAIVALDTAANEPERPGAPGPSVAARRTAGADDPSGMSTLLALAVGSFAGLSCTSLVLGIATRPRRATLSRRGRAG